MTFVPHFPPSTFCWITPPISQYSITSSAFAAATARIRRCDIRCLMSASTSA